MKTRQIMSIVVAWCVFSLLTCTHLSDRKRNPNNTQYLDIIVDSSIGVYDLKITNMSKGDEGVYNCLDNSSTLQIFNVTMKDEINCTQTVNLTMDNNTRGVISRNITTTVVLNENVSNGKFVLMYIVGSGILSAVLFYASIGRCRQGKDEINCTQTVNLTMDKNTRGVISRNITTTVVLNENVSNGKFVLMYIVGSGILSAVLFYASIGICRQGKARRDDRDREQDVSVYDMIL